MGVLQAGWGFDGRISRKPFWLAGLLWTVVFAIAFVVLLHIFSGGHWLDDNFEKTPGAANATSKAVLISYLVLLYPSVAMSVKRLKDLNYGALWCLPMFIPSVVELVADALGFSTTGTDPNALGKILMWVSGLTGLFYVAMLGFVRGTVGPNRFGGDPLSAQTPSGVASR